MIRDAYVPSVKNNLSCAYAYYSTMHDVLIFCKYEMDELF